MTRTIKKKQSVSKSILNDLQKKLPAWSLNAKQTAISKKFPVLSFVDGLAKIARIAVYAEMEQYHPEVTLNSKHLEVTISTGELGHLTANDIAFAHRIDVALSVSSR